MFRKLLSAVLALMTFTACSTTPERPQSDTQPSSTGEIWPTPDKLIALTFDDGPSLDVMPEILDTLAEYDAKATFFIVGRNINAYTTPILKRAFDEDHELGNHSQNHLAMAQLTEQEILDEVSLCQDAITQITGTAPHWFRAPYGSIDDRMYQLIPMPFAGYGASAGDGSPGSNAYDRAYQITSNAYDGAICLLHCYTGCKETAEALKMILPQLKEQGYEFVTISELFDRVGDVPGATPGLKIPDNKSLN